MSAAYDIEVYTVNGGKEKLIEESLALLYAEVERQVNRIPRATVRLIEGKSNQGKFTFAQDKAFAPGGGISIKVKSKKGGTTSLFTGIIVRTQFREDWHGPVFELDLRDPAYRLTRQRNYRVFKPNATDKDAFTLMVKELKDNKPFPVKLGKVAMPSMKHENLVQYDVSDWDFMCMRADACGRVVVVEDGQVDVVFPKASGKIPELVYDQDNLIAAEITADAQDLIGTYEAQLKDITKKGAAAKKSTNAKGAFPPKHFDAKKAAAALGGKKIQEFTTSPVTPPEMKVYTVGKLLRGNLSATRGHIKLRERTDILCGGVLSLKGFAGISSDKVFVAGVKHQFDSMGWTVDVQVGMSGVSYVEDRQWQAQTAHGTMPPVHGLQYAEVLKIEADKKKGLRMLVELAGDPAKKGKYWAYLATPYAGEKHSMWFQPEEGDLVVVGFMNSDPRFPVVLGSIHRKEADNPVKFDPKNKAKGIVVRNGIGITFEDEAGEVQITTAEKPADGQTILMNKKDGWIKINHKNKTMIILDDNGVMIDTDKDFDLKAKNITLDGDAITLIGNKIDLK